MTDRESGGESTAEAAGVVNQQGDAAEKMGADEGSAGERPTSPDEDPGMLATQRGIAKDVADEE